MGNTSSRPPPRQRSRGRIPPGGFAGYEKTKAEDYRHGVSNYQNQKRQLAWTRAKAVRDKMQFNAVHRVANRVRAVTHMNERKALNATMRASQLSRIRNVAAYKANRGREMLEGT